ncbi:MAG: hypothetical protein JOZ38_11100, partial [Candidatus Eremiobacteraeota bacterium]|nr:hypothetical protein [Candidatus Eremiobacteraeota bacterium]
IQVQITTDANGNPVAVATLYDNASGQSVQSAAVGPGGTISGLENVNINVGNFTAADVGTTATIQIQAATAANTQNSALVVQSGPNQGATTNVNLPAVNSSQLAISNLDFSTTLSATNAIGQVQNALTQIEQTQANLGAQQVSLGYAVNNNNIAANNLTTSLSAIQDTNYPSETTNATKNNLLAQINVAVLAQRNNQAASIVGLFTGH